MYIILVYDISLKEKEGTIILKNIFNICKRYLVHTQNSVFEGELTLTLLKKLKKELSQVVRKNVDSIIFYKISNPYNLQKDYIGIDKTYSNNFI